MGKLHFAEALLPDGLARDVLVSIDAGGTIESVVTGGAREQATDHAALALPGMANLHSHAFQRGMAGLAEIGGPSGDSFWTWRQVMYRFLDRLSPDDVEAIAAGLYAEMLAAGFTSVGEFHYLHHAPDGEVYADPAEMAARIAAAATATGIGLTLLPVFYAHGGFGGAPIQNQQRRFASSPDGFARLLDGAARHIRTLPHARLGIAPHSLRAVTPESLAAILDAQIGVGATRGGGGAQQRDSPRLLPATASLRGRIVAFARRRDLHRHGIARLGIFHRIVDQILHHLGELKALADDERRREHGNSDNRRSKACLQTADPLVGRQQAAPMPELRRSPPWLLSGKPRSRHDRGRRETISTTERRSEHPLCGNTGAALASRAQNPMQGKALLRLGLAPATAVLSSERHSASSPGWHLSRWRPSAPAAWADP